MSKQQYKLVNPYVLGKMNTTFTGKNQLEAATRAYNELSQYFNNDIPEFYFTMQKVSSGSKVGSGKNDEYLHFKVQEKKIDRKVDFKIKEVKIEKNSKQMGGFKKCLQKFIKDHQAQDGGSRKYSYDDDNDWLDDEDDQEIRRLKYKTTSNYVLTQPISYWYYDPIVYSVIPQTYYHYTPTFVAPLSPYVVGPYTTMTLYL